MLPGTLTRLCAILGLFAASGCSVLPFAGPDDGAIREGAAVRVQNAEGNLGFDYVLIDMQRDTLPFLERAGASAAGSLSGSATTPPEIRLGVGDVVQVTIFESEAGGLFLPLEAGSRPGNFVQLPSQEIGQNGQITVPYAGPIRAAGNTPSAVEDIIERQLEDRAIEPEATVAVIEQNFARVTVTGAVRSPGTFRLRNSGDRVLDIIASAGGVSGSDYEAVIAITRNGRTERIAYTDLLDNPRANVFVFPGDTINIVEEPVRFFAFGATGRIGTFDFEEAELTLNAAVARAVGLLDNRADPRDVFIYRFENAQTLQRMGVDTATLETASASGRFDQSAVPTIYRVDYRQPDSFFLAQRFFVEPDDIIFVSNSESVDLAKFFNIVSGTAGFRNNVVAIAN
jgi:polysaccharide export outer membrane protein